MMKKKYQTITAACIGFVLYQTLVLVQNDEEPIGYISKTGLSEAEQRLLRGEEPVNPVPNRADMNMTATDSNNILTVHEWPTSEMSAIPDGAYLLHNDDDKDVKQTTYIII